MTLLAATGIGKRYGALTVVDDLSLGVDGGEVLGIVGPNGAGKTTALSLIAGGVPVSSGTISLDGADVTRMPAHARCRAGIGRTFQVPRPFTQLTAFENVVVGALHGGGEGDPHERAAKALRTCGLLRRANVRAASLTLLERKRLEVARALVTQPRLMLLDESAGGLTEAEVQEFLPLVRELVAQGVAVIWIEHVMHALLAVADRVVCIDRGRAIAEGDPETVMASDAVREVYLGAVA